MLRAAVFDLDHTLFDPHTLPRAMFGDLEARIRAVAAGRAPAAEQVVRRSVRRRGT